MPDLNYTFKLNFRISKIIFKHTLTERSRLRKGNPQRFFKTGNVEKERIRQNYVATGF